MVRAEPLGETIFSISPRGPRRSQVAFHLSLTCPSPAPVPTTDSQKQNVARAVFVQKKEKNVTTEERAALRWWEFPVARG
jgi:hypothetical protein